MFSEEYSPLTTLLAIMGPGHVSHQAVGAWGGGGRPGGGGNTMMVTPGAERSIGHGNQETGRGRHASSYQHDLVWPTARYTRDGHLTSKINAAPIRFFRDLMPQLKI